MKTSKDLFGIVIADGHPVTLKGIESILAAETAFCVLEACNNGHDTLRAVKEHQPQILLVDIDLPGKDTLSIIKEISQNNLSVRVILFAISIDEDQLCEAIRLGVRGVLLKSMGPHLILQCLHKVQAGGDWLERKSVNLALEKILRQQSAASLMAQMLTTRELELAALIAKGLNNKDAGEQLCLSEGTVKVYLNRIYSKLKVANRVELTLALQQRGLT